MSLNAIANLAYERRQRIDVVIARQHAGTGDKSASRTKAATKPPSRPVRDRRPMDLQSAYRILTAYFPTEIAAFFVPLISFAHGRFNWQTLLALYLLTTLVINPLLIVIACSKKKRKGAGDADTRLPYREISFGVASCALWAACVPGVFTPMPDLALLLAFVGSFVIPLLDQAIPNA